VDTNEMEFQAIYDNYQPRILRYVAYLVGMQEAEDITQETFVKVSKAIKDFRGDSQLSTWIYRIATNTALDKLRSPAFRQISPGTAAAPPRVDEGETDKQEVWTEKRTPSVEQQIVRKEMNECIMSFIEKLPESRRTVFVLSDIEGLKAKEVAEVLGVTLGTVKIRLHRAREKLKADLAENCDSYWIEDNEFVPNLKQASGKRKIG
jgi:RNA polymerase sigma-70 factor (ECF subfamily)